MTERQLQAIEFLRMAVSRCQQEKLTKEQVQVELEVILASVYPERD